MAKHTPGPWKVESDGRGPYVVADGEPCRICTIECKSFKTNGGPQDWADAHLIAAAPDLLAALEAIIKADDLDPRTWESICAASIAYADAMTLAATAIAKARQKKNADRGESSCLTEG